MATFFVGQRVRIKYVFDQSRFRDYVGRETHITTPPRRFYSVARGAEANGYGVAIDPLFLPCSDQLEPVLPEGHRAGDYSLSDLLDRCRAGEGVPA